MSTGGEDVAADRRRARRRRSCPASTAADPARAAGSGWRPCRRRTPWTTTAERHLDVEGVERRPRGSRSSPPRSRSRRATARPPRDGSRTKASASRVPTAAVDGTVASRRIVRPQNVSCDADEKRRSRSPGTSAISRKIRITPPAIAAGTIVSPAGAGPSKTPVRSRIPLISRVEHVDRVEEDEEGDHPRRRLLARHPRLAQRPVGEHDAAGAAGREQPRRREARPS